MHAEKYYVVDFKNPQLDDSVHYMVIGLSEAAPIKRTLELLVIGRNHLQIDTTKKYKPYDSQPEANAEAKRLGDAAQAANPDRIPADQHFPGQPNQAIDHGMAPA
jgi:hypothetical protein